MLKEEMMTALWQQIKDSYKPEFMYVDEAFYALATEELRKQEEAFNIFKLFPGLNKNA